jgi:hypothetical protein
MAGWSDLPLLRDHVLYLSERAVTPEVAAARGYRSVETRSELQNMGFGRSQHLLPTLAIPIWGAWPTPEPVLYQHRPDNPRRNAKGKIRKFELPARAGLHFDVHPSMLAHVGNPALPLLITEGVVKGDAAVGCLDVCTISLVGVWNWRGSGDDGGKVALADWEFVAVNDRDVVICFDSDVVTKSSVSDAMTRLGSMLTRRGAHVSYCYLPAGNGAAKCGLDDWLAGQSRTWPVLLELCEDRPRRSSVAEDPEVPEDTYDDVSVEIGAELLDDVLDHVTRFVAFTRDEQAVAVALWIMHTHCVESFDSTPRLAVLSPEKQSGKSRLLEVVEPLARNARHTANMSPSFMFRLVEVATPTLLIDEVDAIFRPGDKSHEDLRALVNAGHRRGAKVGRIVGEGAGMEPREFASFSPVGLAGIGGLPDTLLDRSVLIRLRRRTPDQRVEPYRFRIHTAEAKPLHRRLAAWAKRNTETLSNYYPSMPDGMTDRPADVWEPLVAIGDVAGGDWGDRARAAAVALDAERAEAEHDLSWGVMLLSDIRRVFDGDDIATEGQPAVPVDRLTSVDLVERLTKIEDAPWGDLRGKPLDARGLARRLKPYAIRPKPVRFSSGPAKGYERTDFADAWRRYVSASPSLGETVTSVTSVTGADVTGHVTVTGPESGTETPRLTSDVTAVTDVTVSDGATDASSETRVGVTDGDGYDGDGDGYNGPRSRSRPGWTDEEF